jgi:hypothetical protein
MTSMRGAWVIRTIGGAAWLEPYPLSLGPDVIGAKAFPLKGGRGRTSYFFSKA